MKSDEIEKLKKAGVIARKTVEYAKNLIKPGMPLLEIAELIESKIIELGAKPSFPINLSPNEIAAHATPTMSDTSKAHGLLKVDIGVHVDGYIADTAFSIDLEKSDENKKLIAAAEAAVTAAISRVQQGNVSIRQIGAAIEKTVHSAGFIPIQNLSGHSIEPHKIHAGVTIPNYDNSQERKLEEGVYAIEPFTTLTSGLGSVRDGKLSGIYELKKEGPVRDSFAREVLQFIHTNYKTLPFCTRWLQKRFGPRAVLALKRIEEAGLVYHYPQLIEKNGKKVAQAEHTVVLTGKEIIVTTI